ncbi:hypothetical protein GcM3_024052 [Golovinomyces cichoracearum]|uniref:Uncharacterized protein n=1 Tax=Golovinomyces cichoracearum TaxID=62708 RepID=A0A420J6R7_9PEZI|nr:hypothetical protein GcM3_024052 [Golovinomyces cichoracearum]
MSKSAKDSDRSVNVEDDEPDDGEENFQHRLFC